MSAWSWEPPVGPDCDPPQFWWMYRDGVVTLLMVDGRDLDAFRWFSGRREVFPPRPAMWMRCEEPEPPHDPEAMK